MRYYDLGTSERSCSRACAGGVCLAGPHGVLLGYMTGVLIRNRRGDDTDPGGGGGVQTQGCSHGPGGPGAPTQKAEKGFLPGLPRGNVAPRNLRLTACRL